MDVYTYMLDPESRIIHLSDNWDPFALENDGAEFVQKNLLDRQLWEFIRDPETGPDREHTFTRKSMTQEKLTDRHEQGIDIPYDRIEPDTLHHMIGEFVTREWADLSDSGHSLEEKIGQVLQQLKENRVKVVYDLATETWNIVVRN